MDINKILENNVNDLNMALNLAEESSNDTLRKYVQERLQSIRNNQGIYQFISVNSVVDSYIVDLELFYNLSSIVKDIDSKDYFKSKIIEMIKNFPYLSKRSSLEKIV